MNWMTEAAVRMDTALPHPGSGWEIMSPSDYLEANVTVNVDHGLHMIPCSRIALVARDANCEVRVVLDDQVADAKNVLDLLMLKADQGTVLLLQTRGEGADQVLSELVDLFARNFDVPPKKN